MSFQIVILGLLMSRDIYPYEVKRFVKISRFDTLLRINDGKLYYAFDILQKNNLIIPVKTIKEENRPLKTLYSITEEGKVALTQKIKKEIEFASIMSAEFYSALCFSNFIKQKELIKVLKKRSVNIDSDLKNYEKVSVVLQEHTKPGFFAVKNAIMHLEHEKKYIRVVLKDLKNNEFIAKNVIELLDLKMDLSD